MLGGGCIYVGTALKISKKGYSLQVLCKIMAKNLVPWPTKIMPSSSFYQVVWKKKDGFRSLKNKSSLTIRIPAKIWFYLPNILHFLYPKMAKKYSFVPNIAHI